MASDMTICYGRCLEDPDMTILLLFVGHIKTHPDGVKWDIVLQGVSCKTDSFCAPCASSEENCGSG